MERTQIKMEFVTLDHIAKILKKRDKNTHKGSYGRVLVIAGSKGMAGAAVLTAMGALRSGAGLVKVSLDEEFFPIFHSTLPEAICVNRQLSMQDLNSYEAIAIGPGLAVQAKNKDLTEMVLAAEKPALIVDAGALDLLRLIGPEKVKKTQASQKCKLIITPHPGEAAKLLGLTTAEINTDREKSGQRLTEEYGAISMLKGHETLITDISLKQFINTSGNPGMATAGSGDVLTGIIAGFAAQGYTPLKASLLGAYIHGAAGDIGADFHGEHGLLASDIASMAGIAIKKIFAEKKETENE